MPSDSVKNQQKLDLQLIKTVQDINTRIQAISQIDSIQNQILPSRIGSFVDHTCLRPTASESEILATTQEAVLNEYFAICIASSWVPLVKAHLQGKRSPPKIAAVTGFPHGNCCTEAKIYESQWAVSQGAEEIDVVMNLGRLKEGSYNLVLQELVTLRAALQEICIKVIVETAALTEFEKSIALWICWKSGVDFIKTSTGFYTPQDPTSAGATVSDIQNWRRWIEFFKLDPSFRDHRPNPIPLKIKASGGIRQLAQAKELLNAGADRLGASQTAQWVLEP